ncbi:M1 family aminopeptidase [Agrococcus carbonis]|uniref:Peptidase family M1 n=1 Tax=Agrococcus carbonis TaxID=684552 RepID=A0A1H1KSG3_9MICO|nr:M1 family aminopeptidase [Agrococcus carbonis]SDR65288.1 Peptidase family M1 [Agrococcus carbonis]
MTAVPRAALEHAHASASHASAYPASASPASRPPASGDPTWSAQHYDLELHCDVAVNRLEGVARIVGRAAGDLDALELDLVGLAATAVTIDGAPAAWTQHPERLELRPAAPIPAGASFAIEVAYGGSPAPRATPWGEVGWRHRGEGAIAAADAGAAPTWYPCNDRLSDRATLRIRITAEQRCRAIATGALVEETTDAGRTARTFVTRAPTAPARTSLHLGRYLRGAATRAAVPLVAYVPSALGPRALGDLAVVPRMLACFVERFGRYPFDDYTIVVAPDALERPRESLAGAVLRADRVDGSPAAERPLAHLLAHQWFGAGVGGADLQHRWLDDGLARYAEWLWSEAAGDASTDALAHEHHELLADSPQDFALTDPPPELLVDDRIGHRGALLVHALRVALGDLPFFALLQAWAAQHAHGPVTTDDFRRLAGAHARAGTSLDALLDAWLLDPALPPLPSRARRGRGERARLRGR